MEPLFSGNKKLHDSKEVKENALASDGKSCRPETITTVNRYVSHEWRTFQSIIYPAEEKNFIGTSSILAFWRPKLLQVRSAELIQTPNLIAAELSSKGETSVELTKYVIIIYELGSVLVKFGV